jgi:hypothetical protein
MWRGILLRGLLSRGAHDKTIWHGSGSLQPGLIYRIDVACRQRVRNANSLPALGATTLTTLAMQPVRVVSLDRVRHRQAPPIRRV